jgi:hypothetical protein
MIELFGFEFRRKEEIEPPSFAGRTWDDGASQVSAINGALGGSYGLVLDVDGSIRTEGELISRYRQMAEQAEVDKAIDEIICEMVAGDFTVKIVLEDLKQSPQVLKAITDCFSEVTELLNFRLYGYDIVRRWYIDGRCYFHVIIDKAHPEAGIQELRYIDPRKIRKVREIIKKQVRGGTVNAGDAVVSQTKNEYFVYSDRGFFQNRIMAGGVPTGGPSDQTTGLRIAKDSIIHTTSGLIDSQGTRVLSYLHKAIKPLHQLRALEDAALIYRLVRSPERRIWYIDIGNLPKLKAEQYVQDIMAKHKTKIQYDATTGEVRNERKFWTMLEDYWLPVRDGRGTKVDVLPPGAAFNQIDDILFFQRRLYESLHVPMSRLDPENHYTEDVATGITRDEIKFGKFIERMRTRFSLLFVKCLEKQVVLKQIMTIEDFEKVAPYLRFDFVKDNYFMEQKEAMIMNGRTQLAMGLAPFVGRYYSNEWIRSQILKQTPEEQEEEDEKIQEEAMNPQFQTPLGMDPNAQQEQGEDPAVVADQEAIEAPPNQAKPEPNGNGKTNGEDKKPAKKKSPDFKSVAQLLAKGT